MRSRFISFCCYGIATLLTIALLLLAKWGFGPYAYLLVVVSIALALLDHEHAGLWRYETSLPGRSTGLLFIYLIFAWPITFPWYLGFRCKMVMGNARLRKEYRTLIPDASAMGPSGLIQPWRGRKL